MTPPHLRDRFEVRGVDEDRRRLFYMADARRYWDAVLTADLARHWYGHHVVVWDSVERRVLYDSGTFFAAIDP